MKRIPLSLVIRIKGTVGIISRIFYSERGIPILIDQRLQTLPDVSTEMHVIEEHFKLRLQSL